MSIKPMWNYFSQCNECTRILSLRITVPRMQMTHELTGHLCKNHMVGIQCIYLTFPKAVMSGKSSRSSQEASWRKCWQRLFFATLFFYFDSATKLDPRGKIRDKGDCEMYSGISLFIHTGNIYAKILEHIIIPSIELQLI